jgi:uncharacterized OB-fold protein
MGRLTALSTYRPCFAAADGGRAAGADEDVVTMAVAAALPIASPGETTRLVLVSRQAAAAPSSAPAVLAEALGLGDVPVEVRLGGADAAVDALLHAAEGTLVVAAETGREPSAAAALVASGDGLGDGGRARRGFPIAEPAGVHDDPRLVRERAWKPVVYQLASAGRAIVTGPPARAARALASADAPPPPDAEGAPAPLFALAGLAQAGTPGSVVGVEGAAAAAVELEDPAAVRVVSVERRTVVPLPRPGAAGGEIPISLSAFERAFESKVGLKAGRCGCGALSHPPRRLCLECGAEGAGELVSLPHGGEIYSVVTVHVPVPGRRVPYSIAVVELDGVPVRVLAPVTDAVPGSSPIGTRGELVLRQMAVREGVVDYGYAFQPAEAPA